MSANPTGLPARSCGLDLELDQYDPAAVHLPHLADDVASWCMGYAPHVGTHIAPCDTAAMGVESSHGGHSHEHPDGIRWCLGYRTEHAGVVSFAVPTLFGDRTERAGYHYTHEHAAQMRSHNL